MGKMTMHSFLFTIGQQILMGYLVYSNAQPRTAKQPVHTPALCLSTLKIMIITVTEMEGSTGNVTLLFL
jgi:hypothetical protein